MQNDEAEQICGVDRDILERFLILVRDKYPQVDRANFFLELNLGTSGINVGITNQRDALSHLTTLLTCPDLSREDKLAQLTSVEEHFRRGVIESYEKAVNLKLERVLPLYDAYKKRVLPICAKHDTLSSAPDVVSVAARFRSIKELRQRGRDAKRRNRWDAEWEAGTAAFVTAFTELQELEETLERYLVRSAEIHAARSAKRLAWCGIGLAVLGMLLGAVLVVALR